MQSVYGSGYCKYEINSGEMSIVYVFKTGFYKEARFLQIQFKYNIHFENKLTLPDKTDKLFDGCQESSISVFKMTVRRFSGIIKYRKTTGGGIAVWNRF